MLKYVVLLGACISLAFSVLYCKDVIKAKVKPNKVTWLMWSVAPLIATVAALSKGVTWAVVPVFMAGFSPLLIFISSFINKKAYWKITRPDLSCGVLSCVALMIWYLTKNADYAIVFSILSDGLAALPTIIKSWKHPETENIFPYLGGLLSSCTVFFAITTWNFASLAFPVYVICVDAVILLMLLGRKPASRA